MNTWHWKADESNNLILKGGWIEQHYIERRMNRAKWHWNGDESNKMTLKERWISINMNLKTWHWKADESNTWHWIVDESNNKTFKGGWIEQHYIERRKNLKTWHWKVNYNSTKLTDSGEFFTRWITKKHLFIHPHLILLSANDMRIAHDQMACAHTNDMHMRKWHKHAGLKWHAQEQIVCLAQIHAHAQMS